MSPKNQTYPRDTVGYGRDPRIRIGRERRALRATCAEELVQPRRCKRTHAAVRKHLPDLRDYIVNNQTSLTNYANAYRNGLLISSAPAESGMSHVFNQGMGMRYGAVTDNIFEDCGGGARPQ
jgi:hypothetical protein